MKSQSSLVHQPLCKTINNQAQVSIVQSHILRRHDDLLFTATLQSTSLGNKLILDATSMLDVREKELGKQEELNKAVGKLPMFMSAICYNNFDDMFLGVQATRTCFCFGWVVLEDCHTSKNNF